MEVLSMESSEEQFFSKTAWCFWLSAKKYTISQVQVDDFTLRISLGIRKEVPE